MPMFWDTTPAYAYRDGIRHEFRVGVELTQSPATVTASTTSVTVTARRYLQTRYAVYDNTNSVAWSGSWSGSTSFAFSTTDTSGWSKSNIREIGSPLTRTFAPSFTSTTTTSITLSMSGIDAIPGTSSVSGSITTAKRPVSAPDAPTGLQVARVSDARHDLSWTRTNPNDVSKPYTNVIVQRWSDAEPSYKTIATLGNVASYADSSTTAGRKYSWRVAAKNSAGQSAWTYFSYQYTTPAAPTAVKAVRQGADVMVSWTKSVSPHMRTRLAWQQEGGAWQYPGWTSTGTSYLVKSPDPSKPLRYAVLAEADNPDGTRASAWAYSNWVQLLTAPAAPTGMKPAVAEAGLPITLSWQHNSLDTSAQSAFELQWRPRGSTEPWSGVPKTSATGSSHTVPADLWPAGTEVEWQVRTWGQHADPSLWSALALTAVSERPSVTLTEPAEQAWPSSSVTVRWDFFDPEGSEQAGYVVRLYSADTGEVLWERAATSTYRAAAVGYRLQDGMSYEVGVTARDHLGLYSDEVRQRLDVTYAPPPAGVLAAERVEDTGAVVLTISHPAPAEGEVAAVSCDLLRSIDGGPWQVIRTGLALDTGEVDPIPHTSRTTAYRLRTVSALPSTVESDTVLVDPDPRGWIYLNAGPGFSRVVRMRDNAKTSPRWARRGKLHHFAGRRRPTSIRSEQQSRDVGVSVQLAPNPDGGCTYEELENFLAEADLPILYRDAKGRRWWVEVMDLSGSEERVLEEASFTVNEIDHDEAEAVPE